MKPIDLKEETHLGAPATEGASVRKKLGVNRAAALGLAVMLSLSGTLMGCAHQPTEEEEEEDETSYSSSGGHYYHSGGSFFGGSWSKSSAPSGSKSYTSTKSGGSIGG